MEIVVEAHNLRKNYEDFALEDICLQVRRGSITGIFGPNGAGKSTLVKVLARQAPAHGGTVRLFGMAGAEHDRVVKNRLGYVPQEPAFFTDKTVRWTARFAAPYFDRWDGAGFAELLEQFRVNPLKRVKHLSGGEKKLLALALALSHGADLLILDEPTAGLDVLHRRALLDRLRRFVADGGRTVVVASHITDGLDDIAEDVLFLHRGRILLSEDKEDLLARWKWIQFKDGALDPAIEDSLSLLRAQPYGNRGLIGDFTAVRHALEPVLAAGEARVDNASLEDILLSLVTEA